MGPPRKRFALGRAPALLLLLALAAPLGTLRAQIGLTPAVVDLRPSPGAPGVASITVMSTDATPQSLRVYVEDWERGAAGENLFFEPGTRPGSCSPHLRVFPDAVTVGPGEDAVVQVVLDSLPDPSAACWSIVFAETQPPATPDAIRIVQRVGTKVYGLPSAGLRRDAAVSAMTVSEDRPPRVAIDFRNSGSAPLEPRGSMEIRTLDGATVATQAIKPFPILPGARQTLKVPLAETPPPGSYLALAIFDFGGDHQVAGQTAFLVR